VIANQPRQRECAVKDTDAMVNCPVVLGIVRPQRTGDNDGVGVAHSHGLVTNLNVNSI
jgi:hypothetical protein